MKKLTKFVALLLSLIMVVALFAGCAKQEAPAAQTQTETKPAETKTEETKTETKTEEPKQEQPKEETPAEPVKITYSRVMDAATLGYLSDLGEKEDDNRWTQLYEEKLNVDLEMLWSSPSDDDYFTQLNLAVSSGEVPDYIYFGTNFATIDRFHEMDLLVNQEPIIAERGTDALKAALDSAGADAFLPITYDGDRYGLAQIMGGENSSYGFMWIRQDWLDNLGLEVPTTMDELVEVARAFRFDDPDGNGQDDTSGLAAWSCSTKYHPLGLGGFFNAFGSYPERWIEKDGEIVYGSIQPETKEALALLHEMYEEGLIDQEFYANNNTAAQEAAIAGHHGIWIANQTAIGYGNLSSMYQANPEADWIPYLVPTVNGERQKIGAGYNTKAFYGVSTQCPMPEFLVDIYNLQVDLFWNPETATMEDYKTYFSDEAGHQVYRFSLISYEPAGKNAEKCDLVRQAIQTGDTSILYTVDQQGTYDVLKPYYVDNAEMDGATYAALKVFGMENSSNSLMIGLLADGWLIQDAFYGPPTETMSTSLGTLETMEDEAFVQIVTGQQPIDYFDTFVANWLAAGGEQMTKEVNEWKAAK